jgi:hypothetical protein
MKFRRGRQVSGNEVQHGRNGRTGLSWLLKLAWCATSWVDPGAARSAVVGAAMCGMDSCDVWQLWWVARAAREREREKDTDRWAQSERVNSKFKFQICIELSLLQGQLPGLKKFD